MKITICGGGNLGHVCAGFLASQEGNEVSLLTSHPERWSDVIDVTDLKGHTYRGRLAAISAQPEKVIPSADMMLVCLPGFAIQETLTGIAHWLRPQTWVGAVVSSTGFFFEALKLLPQTQPLFGFQRVPFIARTTMYGKSAELKGYKESLGVAVEQADDKETVRATLERLFNTPTKLLGTHYEASLSNSNPLLHTSRLYTLWKDWRAGITYDRNPYFYADWTVETSKLYIAMDEEFQQLLRVLGVNENAIPSVLDYYESTNADSLTQKIRTIPAFQGILSPMKQVDGGWIPDFSSRYFTEDFPYGLRFIVELAENNDIRHPMIDKVFSWGLGAITGKDDR